MALDPIPEKLKELKYWKDRCMAAEFLIEHVFIDKAYQKMWAYKKWLKIKNKKGDK